jgi:hypothetical protein
MMRCLFVLILSLVLTACAEHAQKEPRPLVYEGMSKSELENVLGVPRSIDSTGSVFSAESGKKLKIERWKYEKRTVLIINDTVTQPNIKLP